MDARQDDPENPFGMDEDCRNCPALCDTRSRVVHGYGDVGADFLFVGEAPDDEADRTGVPFSGDRRALWGLLVDLGLCESSPDWIAGDGTEPGADGDRGRETDRQGAGEAGDVAGESDEPERPEPDNAYLTHLTRCRDPDRAPDDGEVRNCEPFLSAEIRMINPEVLVPVGDRALRELAAEYTTHDAEGFDAVDDNGREIRGRGFALVPMVDPAAASDDQLRAFGESFADLMGRDYRQTKGRRGR